MFPILTVSAHYQMHYCFLIFHAPRSVGIKTILEQFIRHRRSSENSPFTTQIPPANILWPMTIFYSDVEPLSEYSPVRLHLSATRILMNTLRNIKKLYCCQG